MPVSKVRKKVKKKMVKQDKKESNIDKASDAYAIVIDGLIKHTNPTLVEINEVNVNKVKQWGNIEISMPLFYACIQKYKENTKDLIHRRFLIGIACHIYYDIEDQLGEDNPNSITIISEYTQLLHTFYEIDSISPNVLRGETDMTFTVKLKKDLLNL